MKQGRLTVLGDAPPDKDGNHRIRVRCDCGTEKILVRRSFVKNKVQSCGCLREERQREAATIHGHHTDDAPTPEYEAWRSMIRRCEDESVDSYAWYGGKGIKVCKRWRESFEAFLADVGERPSDGHLFCLLNKDKDFKPGNAAWRTRHDADRTKRSNTFYEVNGVTKCLVDWAKEYDIPKNTLHYRVVTKGMSMRDALDVGRGRSGKVLPS